eukprot:SAG31_NODE_8990_length_1351_cov_2.449681_1_plen_78_part_01
MRPHEAKDEEPKQQEEPGISCMGGAVVALVLWCILRSGYNWLRGPSSRGTGAGSDWGGSNRGGYSSGTGAGSDWGGSN